MVSNPATSWYFDSISINFIFTDTIMPLLYFLFFLISIFNSFYVLNDTLSYLVFFDLILNLKITLAVSLNLIYYFYLDLYLYLSTKFYYILLVIFKTQRLTLLSNIWNYPELLLITYVFLNHLQICFTFYTTFEFAIYSTYMDNLVLLNFELFNYFFLYLAFTLLILLNVNQFILIKWYKNLNPLFNRIYYFFFSFAVEFRLQFNTTLQLVFFFFFYWSVMLILFDNDKEEFIEFFNLMLLNFFIFVIIFFLYKYSYHYFAFLEASVTEGRSVLFIVKQFVRDVSNTIALFLRFFILLFRLNIYDSLDDFYDSYYIFIGDFDDDDLLLESIIPVITTLFYMYDNNTDKLFMFEEESPFLFDFFTLYFIFWGKFFFFLFLLVEELLRVSLAIYIIYLIILDVHAVNSSYNEDLYFLKKRLNSVY